MFQLYYRRDGGKTWYAMPPLCCHASALQIAAAYRGSGYLVRGV